MSRWQLSHNTDSANVVLGARLERRYAGFADIKACGWLCTLIVSVAVTMYMFTTVATGALLNGLKLNPEHGTSESATTVPQYFQTTLEVYAGSTATASVAPFLAQTNPVPFGNEASFAANAPLQTAIPISGNTNQSSIFKLVGHLSPYFSGSGFGCDEHPIPPGAKISQLHLLHRHGARYPTGDSSVSSFGVKIHTLTENGTAKWSGELSFLNTWEYTLGAEILVARGRQELFDSGVLHYYNYGQLYNTSTKIIARTTTQDRMLKSAEYFMAGFFGLDWTNNATLEVQIEQLGYNTSLAGYLQCPNSINYKSTGGSNASSIWKHIYLDNATRRLRALTGGYNWTIADSYNAQTLCPYETVAYGYSAWCGLFTYEEWEGFEYSIDLEFHGNNGFASPTGRAVGIGYVQEMYARIQKHLYALSLGETNVNITLDTMDSTFPLNQSLYFDFSHDTNIFSVLTAFGLRLLAETLPATRMPTDRSVFISHITPFAARVAFEIVHASQPVKAVRPKSSNAAASEYYSSGSATSYVHLTINQRTVPLHRSYSQCVQRDDGWCELSVFLDILNSTLADAKYEYSCFGDYTVAGYGSIIDAGVMSILSGSKDSAKIYANKLSDHNILTALRNAQINSETTSTPCGNKIRAPIPDTIIQVCGMHAVQA